MKKIMLKFLGTLPQGDAGTEITVRHLIRLIKEGSHDPLIIWTAREIVQSSSARTPFERAKAIFEWVKRNISYTKDPKGLELIRPARKILEDKIGDCDEHVVLTASLFRAIGLPVALVTISTPQNPENFSHIYSVVKVGKIWYPADTIIPGANFGFQYPYAVRKKIWAIDYQKPSLADLEGLEGFFDWIKSIKKKVGSVLTRAWRKGRKAFKEEIYRTGEEFIQRQKQKAAQEIQKAQIENVLMWSLVVITILILAWFFTRVR